VKYEYFQVVTFHLSTTEVVWS